MLTGKAVARAVRANLLVDSALNAIATSQMFDIAVPCVFKDYDFPADQSEGS